MPLLRLLVQAAARKKKPHLVEATRQRRVYCLTTESRKDYRASTNDTPAMTSRGRRASCGAYARGALQKGSKHCPF